jgi:pSer/pThr/pTyr-binding forkhead associated (FHA) protein
MWPELASCQYVSGSHGEICRGSDGWILVDIGSTNGTFVNGQRLESGRGFPLKKGDRVRIATLDFTVE